MVKYNLDQVMSANQRTSIRAIQFSSNNHYEQESSGTRLSEWPKNKYRVAERMNEPKQMGSRMFLSPINEMFSFARRDGS